MRHIDATNAAAYLHETGRLPKSESPHIRELTGGVSNVVLRVDPKNSPPFILKQARERLRVAMDWRARLSRIWTEGEALRVLTEVLPEGQVPALLFEDRDNYLFAITCAPDDSITWKERLIAGNADPELARQLGAALATIHARAVDHFALNQLLADTTCFDELRIDPYYRTICRVHPAVRPAIDELIATMPTADARPTLVLGDYSPKNILVHSGGYTLLDFECAHAGDASFDIGFCLSHLILKVFLKHGSPGYVTTASAFIEGYLDVASTASHPVDVAKRAARGAQHAAACLLARIDGKSPVEYRDLLPVDSVRSLATHVLEHADKPMRLEALIDHAARLATRHS